MRFFLPGVVALLCACGTSNSPSPSINQPIANNPNSGSTGSTETYKPYPLLWEAVQKDGILWSSFAYQIIGNDSAADLLPGTTDIATFCPNYVNLNDAEKVNFWAFLVSAIAKYESGFNADSRIPAATSGIDAITKQPIVAEGLLQISYQDSLNYSFCQFNWLEDQKLPLSSPQVSILDPFNNLECGIKILAEQVRTQQKIAITKGGFWAILNSNNGHNKVVQIQKITKSLPFCTSTN